MPEKPTIRPTRRTFVRSIAYGGAAIPLFSAPLLRAVSPNSTVRHVSFGGEGMAGADMKQLTKHPALRLHAVCDVDERKVGGAKAINPDCKVYTDFRRLLDAEEKHFDSAHVSTPDHMHAPISMSLIQRGKHVYTQKPLTHSIYEARQLRLAAEKSDVVTQMGIQGHASLPVRLVRELIGAGHIGKVREAHLWSGKEWGGGERPSHADPVPASLNWDLWLGVAPQRPYADTIYHPTQWRRWLDFGTGTLGDMGCHIVDPVIWAMDLREPTHVQSVGPAPWEETWPIESEVRFTFPATPQTDGPLSLTWYDGVRRPPARVLSVLGDSEPPHQGSILIGEKGALHLPHGGSAPKLLPRERFMDVKYPRLEPRDHWFEFVDAIRGEGETHASFAYSGTLTETVLLGCLALRLPGEALEWDASKLTFGRADADAHVRRTYRKGWEVAGL